MGWLALVALTLAATAWPATAQTRVYRCGNEYTNRPQGRTDCTLLEGGNITIVEGTRPAAAPPASAPAPAASPPRGNSASKRASTSSYVQRKRDADAKAILEEELRRAEKRQSELEDEYQGGQPDKIGGEARNYQKYLDRVADLKASIERNQSDIEGIKRELERFQ